MIPMRPMHTGDGRIARIRHTRAMSGLGYEIRVRGEVTYALANALTAMGWTVDIENGSTILRGLARDQAELTGILDAVSVMSLELLEVRRTDDDARDTP